ncbi:tetratricopeptide repeat protein [Actinoplanes sp. NPDC051411]|uniref:AfsR/SARP family transcriptional regulator n=1 Tax=Actinoplanes sp. NPDC051411 TaxID=3155522 RepID=UPI0034366B2A
MEFGILGSTQLIDNGRSVPLGPAKQRGMLSILLHRVGEPVRADALIDLLWHPRGTADHRPTLYSIASRLRAVLAQAGLDRALVRVPGIGAYRLDVDPGIVDLHRFRTRLAVARATAGRGDRREAAEILVPALLLWRGEPLAELRGPRAEQVRTSLNQHLLDAHRLLAECRLACGHHHSVLAQLESLVLVHDLDEGLARCWAGALRAVGRGDEARRFVAAFQRRFRKEMHTEPDIDESPVRVPPRRIPRQLPPDIGDFTGRESLLAELSGNNVVVITGMPGVGKTTLAVHWAHCQRNQYPDGQLYLDAAAYGHAAPIDPEDVLDRFLRALGVPSGQLPVTPEQRRDRYEELVGDRRILVVLDNVRDSAQVRPLIPRSMKCLTIITSRVRLSALTIRDGVRTVVAAPLPQDESRALLARIVGERAATDGAGLAALARLSGGLPLAVRVIGERVAERPLASLGDLVDELRHRLLDATDGDDQAASLNAFFDWSYHALDPDVAHLFRRISLHPGSSISPEAAAAIAGDPLAEVEGRLNVLAKAHMINHDTARRYRFHGLLHRYASRQAAAQDDPADTARDQRRLLNFYLLSAANAMAVIAPEWPPMPDLPDDPSVRPITFAIDTEAMKWCDTERDNLGVLSLWADRNGHHRYGWQIPGVLHEMFERHGSPADLLRLNQQALEAARNDGHEKGQIGTLVNLGTTYFTLHDYDRAIAAFIAAQEFASATGHIEEEGICLQNLAATYVSLGQVTRAIEIYGDALAICRKIGNPVDEAVILHWLGEAYLRLGHYQGSADSFHQALAIRQRLGAKRGTGQTHSGLGTLYLAAGRPQLALRHCEAALAIHVHAHDEKAECDTLITLVAVQSGLGAHPDAIRNGRRAVLLSERIGDLYRQVEALTATGDALLRAGDRVGAEHQIRAAARTLDGLSGVDVSPLRNRLTAVERGIRPAGPESRAS